MSDYVKQRFETDRHTYIHQYIHAYIRACTHTDTHARTHADTHTHNDDKSTATLVSRRKRNERKEINVFLNYKLLKQVNTIKYLGIIMDTKFKFREHITYAAEKCTKLIYSRSKSAKITWGLRHEVLKMIYEGAIHPLCCTEPHSG